MWALPVLWGGGLSAAHAVVPVLGACHVGRMLGACERGRAFGGSDTMSGTMTTAYIAQRRFWLKGIVASLRNTTV